jgi:hypothetical protein
MKLLVGLGAIAGAVWLSRGGRGGGLGDLVPTDARGESLDEVERTALRLYPVVDDLDPSDVLYSDTSYQPDCDAVANAEDALAASLRAQEEGLQGELPVRVAATQAWSLTQMKCPGTSAEWALEAVEWPG